MNAASLLESFPKTKTKRFKVIKLSESPFKMLLRR